VGGVSFFICVVVARPFFVASLSEKPSEFIGMCIALITLLRFSSENDFERDRRTLSRDTPCSCSVAALRFGSPWALWTRFLPVAEALPLEEETRFDLSVRLLSFFNESSGDLLFFRPVGGKAESVFFY
jgi:hypothetical protein